MTLPRVFFYPHAYLRDRQLDTIRHWPTGRALNPELADRTVGGQVSKQQSLAERQRLSWKQRLPLPNIKRRPPGLPEDVAVYVWGAVMASGPFILDLDNPYALTGYNLRAMSLYRGVLRRILSGSRCLEIRCLSEACRETLRLLFGAEVWRRARVHYPWMRRQVPDIQMPGNSDQVRFLFVGTQFEIKGGAALIRAFQRVHALDPRAHLDLITHLPEEYVAFAGETQGITVHEAAFPGRKFLRALCVTPMC